MRGVREFSVFYRSTYSVKVHICLPGAIYHIISDLWLMYTFQELFHDINQLPRRILLQPGVGVIARVGPGQL